MPCSSTGSHPWIVPDAVFAANALGNPTRFQGPGVASLFASVGVMVSSDPPNSVLVADDRDLAVDDATTWRMFGVPPSSSSVWHDVLTQSGGHPVSFTLTFAQPVLAIRFVRAALITGPSGITHPGWEATAVDARGGVLASVQEAPIASYSGVPPRDYDLIGTAPISAVTFYGDNQGWMGFTNLVVQLIGWCR